VSLELRDATPGDAEAIAAIHDEAVLAGNATLRTEPRPLAEVEEVLRREDPFLVALDEGEVVGWASVGPYEESNPYYEGVGEVAVYVSSKARGRGAGSTLLDAAATAARATGRFKLVAKVFTTNEASLRLFERAGYSRVGTHFRHGRLRGEWKDVVVLERLLGEAGA
jgi:phosphinothricin acetyltransferase